MSSHSRTEFVAKNVYLDDERTQKFLTVEPVGGPVGPCGVTLGVETLDENERLEGRLAGFEGMDAQTAENFGDGHPYVARLRYPLVCAHEAKDAVCAHASEIGTYHSWRFNREPQRAPSAQPRSRRTRP